MTYSLSRGIPFSLPPRPMITRRMVRSLMSTTRGQLIEKGSIRGRSRGGGGCRRKAEARLCAAPIRVDVAVRWRVEVLHRDDLAVAAARGPPLIPKTGPSDGWRMATDAFPPDPVEALRQPDGGRRLALAERRRRDRGNHHVLPRAVPASTPLDARQGHLRLRRPVQLQLGGPKPRSGGDVADGARGDGAGDLEVGGEAHGSDSRGRFGASAREPTATRPSAWLRAARMRWVSRIALVSGPTPPGTGAIADTTVAARGEVDVADDAAVPHVDAHVHDHGARLEHLARD